MWNENRVYFTCMSFELISSKRVVNSALLKLPISVEKYGKREVHGDTSGEDRKFFI